MQYPVWSINPRTRATQKEPYIVEAHDEGKRWTCTCPHFVIRLKGKSNCKHIDYVIDHNKQQERIQAEVAKSFEDGYGFDMDEQEKPKLDDQGDEEGDDVSVAPAS